MFFKMRIIIASLSFLFLSCVGFSQTPSKIGIVAYFGLNGGLLANSALTNSPFLLHPNPVFSCYATFQEGAVRKEIGLEFNQFAADVPVNFRDHYLNWNGVFFMKASSLKLSADISIYLNKNKAKHSSLIIGAGLNGLLFGHEEGYCNTPIVQVIISPDSTYSIAINQTSTEYRSNNDRTAFQPFFASFIMGYQLEREINGKTSYLRFTSSLSASPYNLGVSHNLKTYCFQATLGVPIGTITRKVKEKGIHSDWEEY